MSDIVERLGCLMRAEGGSRDHGLPEIVSAMRDAKAEIERLRTALRRVQNLLQDTCAPLDNCIRETLEALDE